MLYKSLLFALMSAAFVAGQACVGPCPGSQVCCAVLTGTGEFGQCIDQDACVNGMCTISSGNGACEV